MKTIEEALTALEQELSGGGQQATALLQQIRDLVVAKKLDRVTEFGRLPIQEKLRVLSNLSSAHGKAPVTMLNNGQSGQNRVEWLAVGNRTSLTDRVRDLDTFLLALFEWYVAQA